MIVVSDTSSVTNLWQIQPLDLLERLFQEVIVPPAIETELFRIPAQQQDLKQIAWLKTKVTDSEAMAKKQPLIKAVKPLMDALQQQARFFIHRRLYDEVLTLAGEQQT